MESIVMLGHLYFSRLDHLRFFAATLVVFHHFRGNIKMPESIDSVADVAKAWLAGGSTGVTLFLVLSGFLFCVISDAGRKPIVYRDFLRNRILRIFPLLLLLFFVVITVSRQSSGSLDILRLLTLQLNTGHSYTGWGHEFFPVGPIWTIAVEFQFYLIFPFLAVLLREFGVTQLLGMILIMVLTKYLIIELKGPDIYSNLYHTIIGRLDQFLVGMILGALYLHGNLEKWLSSNLAKAFLAITTLGFLTWFVVINSKHYALVTPISFAIEGAAWAAILYCYLTFNVIIPRKLDGTLRYLGNLSYSVYLIHLPVGMAIRKIVEVPPSNSVATSIMYTLVYVLPVTLGAAALLYTFIEKPFLSLKKGYTR